MATCGLPAPPSETFPRVLSVVYFFCTGNHTLAVTIRAVLLVTSSIHQVQADARAGTMVRPAYRCQRETEAMNARFSMTFLVTN